MAKYKINFKDSNHQYVEKYYAGESGMPITIYYTEGDEITPKKYFATVGVESVEGADIDEIKKNIDKAVNERTKKLAKVNDSKKVIKDKNTIDVYSLAKDFVEKHPKKSAEKLPEYTERVTKEFQKQLQETYGKGYYDYYEAENTLNTVIGDVYYMYVKDCDLARGERFTDASAEDIIDLFEEAYIKGRSWDWLKNKLPKTFLELQGKKNRGWDRYDLFPIQADRTGHIEGVNLTKPRNLSEETMNEINAFVDALEKLKSTVDNIDAEYTPVDTYNYYKVKEALEKAIKETDSKSQSQELETIKNNFEKIASDAYRKADRIPSMWYVYSDADKYIEDYNKLGREGFIRKLIKKVNSSDRNKDYINNQKRPLIYNREETGPIRSDSKVGLLSEEAKNYIRRIMGEATTEDIEAKRQARKRNWNDPYDYYRVNRREDLPQYSEEISKIKSLLRDLKEETAKEKRMDISVHNRQHGHYKYTGKGNYDYQGRYNSRNGGYEWSNETVPTTVSIDIQGLNQLSTALEQILNSGSVAEVERNLQQALDVVKTLPRNNPKVATIKSQIQALLENRKNAPKKKRNLPDKKFKRVTDSFSIKELKEYMELCRKLGLNTAGDIEKFAKDHGNVSDKDLLEALRKEAKK